LDPGAKASVFLFQEASELFIPNLLLIKLLPIRLSSHFGFSIARRYASMRFSPSVISRPGTVEVFCTMNPRGSRKLFTTNQESLF
jgi:hypothetical protein